MEVKNKRFLRKHGFTIVEVLTAVAIIAILVGLLIPALNMVRDAAVMVKQKSQFHSIDVALEAYLSEDEFAYYPLSERYDETGTPYCGAQKLAEAVIGWDGFGIHPKSVYRSDGSNDINGDGDNELVYNVQLGIVDLPDILETAAENLAARKSPYLELEVANAVKLRDIYDAGDLSSANLNGDTYVLTDMFRKVTHKGTGKSTGMPILYYKANPLGIDHDPELIMTLDEDDNTYNLDDNIPIFERLPVPFDDNIPGHPLSGLVPDGTANYAKFYNPTTNPNFTTDTTRRPYRSESHILHSAGPDGLYGTPDDVFNFDPAN